MIADEQGVQRQNLESILGFTNTEDASKTVPYDLKSSIVVASIGKESAHLSWRVCLTKLML